MKRLIIIFCLIYISVGLDAQGLFIRASVSHDGDFMPSQFHSPIASLVGQTRIKIDNYTFSEKVSTGTYGSGRTFSLSLGADISPHLSVLIDMNYQKGNNVEDAYLTVPHFSASQNSQSKTIRLQPSLLLSSGMDKALSVYVKSGLSIPMWGSVITTTLIDDTSGQIYSMLTNDGVHGVHTVLQLKSKTSGTPSIGLHTSLGIDIALSKKISVFTEAQFNVLQIGLKETELIDAVGQIKLPGLSNVALGADLLPEYFKSIQYVDEITSESNAIQNLESFDPNIPLDALDYGSNFNSAGISIGLKLKI